MNARARSLFAKFALGGLVSYAACLVRHWCQCGHMEHAPYLWWDYVLDISWVTLFAAAGVASTIGWGIAQPWPLLLSGLIATRFLLPHTMGCSVILFEVPGSLALLGRSIWVLAASRNRNRTAGASEDIDENEDGSR